MICRRLSRRITVGVATLVLLLCQGAVLADACKAVAPRTDTTGIQAPCHESPHTKGTADDGSCQSRCPSQFATVEPLKLNIPVADLPTAVAWMVPPAAVEHCLVAHDLPLVPAQPPPITRLYCRMLI